MNETSFPSEKSAFSHASPARLKGRIVFYFYTILLLVSFLWLALAGRLGELKQFSHKPLEAFIVGTLFAVLVVGFTWLAVYVSRSFRRFVFTLTFFLGPLPFPLLFLSACCSGVAEELFFRGAMQPAWGVWWTSLNFALCHFPLIPQLLPWTLFTFVAGLGLGFLQESTQNLLAPISAHFWINFINFYFLQYYTWDPAETEEWSASLSLFL